MSQTANYSVAVNTDSILEEDRTRLIIMGNKVHSSYTAIGEGPAVVGGLESPNDIHVPDPTTKADLVKVLDESGAIKDTQISRKLVNQVQSIVKVSGLMYNASTKGSTPGDIATIMTQNMLLTSRIMKIINDVIASNLKSDDQTMGSINSFLKAWQDGHSGGANGLITVTGYNKDTERSRAIIDTTLPSNQGTLNFVHLFEGIANIDKNLNGHTQVIGSNTDNNYIAFLPSLSFAQLINSGALTGTMSVNRTQTGRMSMPGRENGVMFRSDITSISTPWGNVVLIPVTTQIGDVANNNNNLSTIILEGATKVQYQIPPTSKELTDKATSENTSVRCMVTLMAPHELTGQVIAGLKQAGSGKSFVAT